MHNGGKRMKEINMDEMEYGTPEYAAAEFITLCYDQLDRMDEKTFELWFGLKLKSKELKLGETKLNVPETKKKAILHFIAFWYYRNKEQ